MSSATTLPGPTKAPCGLPDCQRALTDARQQAGSCKALHHRARQREERLQAQIALLQAEIRDLRHRLFGRSSEVHYTHNSLPDDPQEQRTPAATHDPAPPATAAAQAPPPPPRRPRGQQRGAPGHGRRAYAHLPTREEPSELPAEQCRCPRCGQPFAPFPGTDDTTVLEVFVHAHRRLIHRRRYRPTCTCGAQPGILTAPLRRPTTCRQAAGRR